MKLLKSSLLFALKETRVLARSKRYLNLYEYQSKSLLAESNLTIQKFQIVTKKEEISQKMDLLGECEEYVVKAQILAGGRGKGKFKNGTLSGVQLTKNKSEAATFCLKMLNENLVTLQTGPNGEIVSSVMIAEAIPIEKECYLSVCLDPTRQGITLIVSEQGGVDIERIAEQSDSVVKFFPVDPWKGLAKEVALEAASSLGLENHSLTLKVANDMRNLCAMLLKLDALQIEINPYGITPSDMAICYDAKFRIDENAKFRQKDIFSMDHSDKSPMELKAEKLGVNYVEMDGNVGCIVNGAGLAMATMDFIKINGFNPANFLDLGGSVTADVVKESIILLALHPKVEKIFINVFGGIVNCSIISDGIVRALQQLKTFPKIILRLQGTNRDLAIHQIMQSSINQDNLNVIQNMQDAADHF